MEEFIGNAFERFSELRQRIARQCEECAEKYGPWAFIGMLILSALFGWD